jgi:hypothetical protein
MPSITVLIVEKLGNIKESTLKTFDENELYKKAGHTSATGFKCYTQWNIKDLNEKSYNISVYGKTTGRANSENKYEFPPPIDNTLFFGSCLIVNYEDENTPVSITSDEWDSIYEHLYGGFEDIGDEAEDEASNNEEDEYADIPVTKSGYAKDGFVVDDEDDDASYDEVEEADDEDEDAVYVKEKPKKAKKQTVAKQSVSAPKEKKSKAKTPSNIVTKTLSNVFTAIVQEPDTYLDCTSELSEESYV